MVYQALGESNFFCYCFCIDIFEWHMLRMSSCNFGGDLAMEIFIARILCVLNSKRFTTLTVG